MLFFNLNNMNKEDFYKKINELVENYRSKKYKNKPVNYKSGKELEKIINKIDFKSKNYEKICEQL